MEKQEATVEYLPQARSVGKALLILAGVGTAAISSFVWMFDLSPDEVAPPVWAVLNSSWTWVLLAGLSNIVVLQGATRPTYRAAGRANGQALLHSLVLLLALLFHLLSLLWVLLLAAFSYTHIGYGAT